VIGNGGVHVEAAVVRQLAQKFCCFFTFFVHFRRPELLQ
jgi:hypothetical protein